MDLASVLWLTAVKWQRPSAYVLFQPFFSASVQSEFRGRLWRRPILVNGIREEDGDGAELLVLEG
jgi:hypothetical protein